ncbi:MAG: hypothetical protein ACKOTZ_09130, partial [Chloroflexota bacterium]
GAADEPDEAEAERDQPDADDQGARQGAVGDDLGAPRPDAAREGEERVGQDHERGDEGDPPGAQGPAVELGLEPGVAERGDHRVRPAHDEIVGRRDVPAEERPGAGGRVGAGADAGDDRIALHARSSARRPASG